MPEDGRNVVVTSSWGRLRSPGNPVTHSLRRVSASPPPACSGSRSFDEYVRSAGHPQVEDPSPHARPYHQRVREPSRNPGIIALDHDLSALLRDWPFDPERLNVRLLELEEDRIVVQVGVELGVLQMEQDGRPGRWRGSAGSDRGPDRDGRGSAHRSAARRGSAGRGGPGASAVRRPAVARGVRPGGSRRRPEPASVRSLPGSGGRGVGSNRARAVPSSSGRHQGSGRGVELSAGRSGGRRETGSRRRHHGVAGSGSRWW